jgi:hypothetical protein
MGEKRKANGAGPKWKGYQSLLIMLETPSPVLPTLSQTVYGVKEFLATSSSQVVSFYTPHNGDHIAQLLSSCTRRDVRIGLIRIERIFGRREVQDSTTRKLLFEEAKPKTIKHSWVEPFFNKRG